MGVRWRLMELSSTKLLEFQLKRLKYKLINISCLKFTTIVKYQMKLMPSRCCREDARQRREFSNVLHV